MAGYGDVLKVEKPVAAADLIKKPAPGGRQPSPTDLALIELVNEVSEPGNKEMAYPWDFSPMKPITARAAATRAIDRAGAKDKVFVSARDGKLWFSQTRLSNRGRRNK